MSPKFGRHDGRGLRRDEIIKVFLDDANSYFVMSQFRQEVHVDDEKTLKWSTTNLYKLMKKECQVGARQTAVRNFCGLILRFLGIIQQSLWSQHHSH